LDGLFWGAMRRIEPESLPTPNRHTPRRRGIQYAAAYRVLSLASLEYWIARSRLRQRLRRGFAVLARRSFSGGGKPGDDSRRYSRGAFRPGFANRSPKQEGAGNAGCLLHPRSRVQEMVVEAHTSIQVQSEHSGIPCAVVLRLMARSPRRRIPLASVIGELTVLQTRLGLRKPPPI
jgi:hypothetical protein